MSLIYNATFDKNTRKLSFEDKAGNEIYSFTVPEREKDDLTKPLTLRAKQDGSTVKLTKRGNPSGTFQTSRDGGSIWVDYTLDSAITLNIGEEVSFRSKSDRTSAQSYQNCFRFEMTGKIEAWHNVMSMYRTNDFATYNTMVESAFQSMFSGCTSLTKAPVLPATTLTRDCYERMFEGCQSLKVAPALPVTTLVYGCYSGMFNGCRSLTKAPELPATTLADFCYYLMFSGCSSLNEMHCQIPSSYSSDQISSYASYWLGGVAWTGTFYTNADANWPSGESGIPTRWQRVNEETPTVDDINKPLTFRATQDGSTVKLTKTGSPTGDFQTSRDGGNTWEDYTIGTAITLNTGDEVSFRAKSDRTSAQNNDNYFQFKMTGKIEAWHNVMSLYRTNDFATFKNVVDYAFSGLFRGCTSLAKAPVLPATTLAIRCYWSLFSECQSLTKAPELPATTLATSCYLEMFSGCQSLTEAPELPATTLAQSCYYSMFSGCQSLTKAPELPATTLATNCYLEMFSGCQSLTEAPELPATTLAQSCYLEMFSGCQSLKEVRISATTTATSALNNWLNNVSATGDFYCDPNATIFPTGASGIPANWNRHALADYPVTP